MVTHLICFLHNIVENKLNMWTFCRYIQYKQFVLAVNSENILNMNFYLLCWKQTGRYDIFSILQMQIRCIKERQVESSRVCMC